jgi:hypothetical protein
MRIQVMAARSKDRQISIVSGEMNKQAGSSRSNHKNTKIAPARESSVQKTSATNSKEKTQMKKFAISTLLTAVAVPFLVAAPAAKKAQNTSTTSTTSTKVHKKKSKKNGTSSTEGSTTSTSTSK